MGLEAGQIIEGKYRIVRLLGEGGMGAVYEGENVRIHRRVAIKVLHSGIAENVDAVQRFEREAQAAGRIGSDHIVEVLDLGNLSNGDRFMVMEYLDGDSLSRRIQNSGRITQRNVVPIMTQLLEGLGAAHAAGIIHRDLKPDNVFLLKNKKGQGDFVKILDFGISKFSALTKDSGMSMTRTGAVMGTPYYMAPEQAKGAKDMDARADLYSVGVILYEAITGKVPFDAETFNELIFKIVLETPPPPEQLVPDLDPAFSSIIRKSMAREANDRFQTAAEFSQALSDWLSSGRGVVAPAPGQSALGRSGVGQPPAVPGGPMLQSGTPSPSAFGSTGVPVDEIAGLSAKPSSKMPMIIGATALCVMGFAAVAGVKMLKGGDKGAPAAMVETTAPAVPAAQPVAPVVQPTPTPTVAQPAPTPAPDPATDPASASAALKGAALLPGKKPALIPIAPVAPVGKHPSDKPAAAAAPPAAPAAPPPAAPAAAPAATGRKIRTEL